MVSSYALRTELVEAACVPNNIVSKAIILKKQAHYGSCQEVGSSRSLQSSLMFGATFCKECQAASSASGGTR
eukprot:1516212-Amphidinium_carterae.1